VRSAGTRCGQARVVSLRGALEGLVVADLMRVHSLAAQADQTLRDLMTEVNWADDSVAYPVLDGLRPVGILPSRPP
jgi:hypothetical protein